jgi:D-alanyl-D-alanine carboxypeptidase/D-alanyl-D-alanine-endopeptidase (penicillin-binding protein 4)
MTLPLSIATVILLTTTLAGSAPAPPFTLKDLAPTIRAHIDQDRFREAFWGIRIESLDSGRVLFTHNADKLLKPASCAKLFTAALALDRLGPDCRLRTSCYARQPPTRSGTLKGDLWIYGRGDFSYAARFHEGDYQAALRPLLQALQIAGIRRIRGGLIGDATYFHGPQFGSGWTWDDLQFYYGAEVSPLMLEDNVVDLLFRPGHRTGSPCFVETRPHTTYLAFALRTSTVDAHGARAIELYRPLGENVVHVTGQLPLGADPWTDAVAVHDAPRWFVTQLGSRLTQQKVRIGKPPRTLDWLSPAEARPDYTRMVEIAAVDSPPLAELVRQMMKPSQNLYAQALFLQVGRQRQSRQPSLPIPAHYTEVSALAELGDFLVELGISTNSVKLDDGAGLSRRAMVTPNAIVALLKRMDQHRHAEAFQSSLPVAGVDGTLRNRMRDTPAAGRVRAKTGSLAHVYTLSGYATTTAGERLVFSFMLNNPASSSEARSDLDNLAVLLAALEERS